MSLQRDLIFSEKDEKIYLTRITGSSMVKAIGFSYVDQEIYIEYRDCIWAYPSSSKEYIELFKIYEKGESVGIFVNQYIKPRGGRKVYSE